jgi:hypothetical protein
VAAVACAVGVVLVIVFNGSIIGHTGSVEGVWAFIAVLVTAIVLLVMGFYFLRHMKRIIDRVKEGDPFIPENADRLTAMAWLMLAMHLIAIPFEGAAIWLADEFGEEPTAGPFSGGGNGLLLILTLFILARVFKRGTEMREELEGTV